jgi:hypothetical protein
MGRVKKGTERISCVFVEFHSNDLLGPVESIGQDPAAHNTKRENDDPLKPRRTLSVITRGGFSVERPVTCDLGVRVALVARVLKRHDGERREVMKLGSWSLEVHTIPSYRKVARSTSGYVSIGVHKS